MQARRQRHGTYLPEDGEEGGRVDDEGAVEAAGVVVGDDLERAHEQVEESRRRAEKACAAKRFASSRQSSVNQSPLFFSPDSTAHTFPPFFSSIIFATPTTTRFKPHRREASELPCRDGEEKNGLPQKRCLPLCKPRKQATQKRSLGQGPGTTPQQRHGNAGPT